MPSRGISLVFLHPLVAENQWSFLHRFFHPGSRDKEKQYVFLGTSVDISHPVFLSAIVVDFSNNKGQRIFIPYSLVSAIVEREPRKIAVGFQHLQEPFDKAQQFEKT